MKSIEEAKRLFAEEKYSEAFDVCNEIIKEQVRPDRETYLYMANSFMMMTHCDNWAENNDTYYEAAENVFKLVTNLEQALEADYQIRYTMKLWETQQHRIHLERIRRDTTNERWKAYLTFQQNNMISMAFILMALRKQENLLKICEENNMTIDDFTEMCNQKSVLDVFPREEINDIKCDIGYEFYQHTRNVLEENNEGSKEFLIVIGQRAILNLYLADTIISSSIDEETKERKKLLERLYKHAELKRYMLEATLHPLGGTMSLLVGDRSKQVGELKAVYEKIKDIDAAFVMPSLPRIYGMDPTPPPGYTNSSSGGCYVATAVYGSYDCPEVWTLRRFRDYTLSKTWSGRAFIHLYYAISPTLVRWFGHTKWFKDFWKGKLDDLVANLLARGVENTPYEDKIW